MRTGRPVRLDHDRIIQEYREGLSRKIIAHRNKCGQESISRIVRRYGETLRRPRGCPAFVQHTITLNADAMLGFGS
jgi:hypothetical protein